jgi:hypothetical protein
MRVFNGHKDRANILVRFALLLFLVELGEELVLAQIHLEGDPG